MKKKVLYAIVGETCAGKDTVTKILCERFNTKMVVSYTSRKMRSSDKQGVNHNFVSKQEFDKLILENDVIAYTQTGQDEYCAIVSQLEDAMFYIVNPDGIHWFNRQDYTDIELVTFYITLPLDERRLRASKRNDTLAMFKKRVIDEKEDFDNFALNKEYDYSFVNWSSVQTADIIEGIIRYLEAKRDKECLDE